MSFPLDLVRQVRHAYLDMPGLSLTLPQMRRLFNAGAEDCATAAATLADAGLLSRRGEQYVRTIADRLPPALAMRLRAAPFDCRWAEPLLAAAPAPFWLEAGGAAWACVRDGEPRALDAAACRACPRWDPRLATRRRARQARRPQRQSITGTA